MLSLPGSLPLTNDPHSLDLIYFGRETAWQPAEGQLPGPDPRHVANDDGADEDEDEDNGVMLNA